MSTRDVRFLIFKYFRPIIKMPDIPTISTERRKHMNPETLLEEEYRFFFENSNNSNGYEY
jgi:hypothetical protein